MPKKDKVAKASPNKLVTRQTKKPAPEAAASTAATGELARGAKVTDRTIIKMKDTGGKAKANVKAMATTVDGLKAKSGKVSAAESERKGPLYVRGVRVKGTAVYLTIFDNGNSIEREAIIDENVVEELHAAFGKVLKALGVESDEDEEDEDEWEEDSDDDENDE